MRLRLFARPRLLIINQEKVRDVDVLDISKAKVGDRLKSRRGTVIKVEYNNGSSIPVKTNLGWFNADGTGHSTGIEDSAWDIVEWVKSEKPKAQDIISGADDPGAQNEMRLEVGKTYRTASGKHVKIDSKDDGNQWPYSADNGHTYLENGRVIRNRSYPDFDLVAEVAAESPASPPNEQPFKIEVGKYYRTRDGRKAYVSGPHPFLSEDSTYKFAGFIDGEAHNRAHVWTAKGEWLRCKISGKDLIAEWSEPAEPKRIKGWLNIDADNMTRLFDTRREADNGAFSDRIACIEIDVAEGEGLETEAA